MKKLFAFMCVMLFLQNLLFAEEDVIIVKTVKETNETIRTPRSIIMNVTGFYDTETGKATLYFYQSIGDATVSLTDETGAIVYSRIVDTENTDMMEFSLPAQSGTYILSIVSATYEGIGRIVL